MQQQQEQQQQWHASSTMASAADAEQQKVAGQCFPRGAMPKVPSLVFDIELEERSESRAGDHEHIGVKELKRWLLPGSTGEFKLRNDVEMGLAAHQQQRGQPTALERNQALASFLTRLGYRVHIRTALGGGEGFECLRNLRHVFLAVLPPGAHATTNRFVVDLSFKEQFRIAKPTARYQALLDCVPGTYVAPEASVAPLVNCMCHEMALAFSSTGVVLPPWRQTHSMLSKWLPRKSLDEQVLRPPMAPALPGVTAAAPAGALHAMAAAHAVPRRSMDMSGQVHGHWVANGNGHAQQQDGSQRAAAQQQQQQQQQLGARGGMAAPPMMDARALASITHRPSAGLVKPLSCEPQRVMVGGNFSAIGFA